MTQQYGVGNYGFAPNNGNNTAGGVALSNKQTDAGVDCEALIWATGDALRFSGFNPADGGQDYIYGVAGISVSGNSIVPGDPDYIATSSIYIDVDYTGNGNSGSTKMFFGDMEIYTDQQVDPNFTITDDQTICPGESIDLNVSGGSNYNWTPAGSLDDATTANPEASPATNTTYTVIGDGACGGKDTVSVTISVEDYDFTLGPDLTICAGSTTAVTLDAGIQNSYSWTPGLQNTQTIDVTSAGVYVATITTTNNCTYMDDIEVKEGDAPIVNFSTQDSSSCSPATFHLVDETTAFGGDPISTWSWEVNGQNNSNSTTFYTLEDEGSYDVTLTVVSERGCLETLTIPNLLVVDPSPKPNFTVSPNTIDLCNTTVEITNNTTTPYSSLSWSLGDGTYTQEDTLSTYTFAELGNYNIGLVMTNDFDCQNEIYHKVNAITEIDFFVPNAFTPNNDGINDVFHPNLYCVENYSIAIVDRWGEEIFRSTDLNQSWDGRFKDQLCQVGLYAWKIKYDGIKINQVKTGEVHLMH
jgi:gliding motility-associated-like protein